MYWDCFSPYVDVQRRNRLANCRAELVDYKGVKRKAKKKGKQCSKQPKRIAKKTAKYRKYS